MEITWIDAETVGDANWMTMDESNDIAKSPLPIMLTVGYVLWEDDDMISVVNTIGPDQSSQVNKIPKKMVYKIEEI